MRSLGIRVEIFFLNMDPDAPKKNADPNLTRVLKKQGCGSGSASGVA
jgi:hypothetical protein